MNQEKCDTDRHKQNRNMKNFLLAFQFISAYECPSFRKKCVVKTKEKQQKKVSLPHQMLNRKTTTDKLRSTECLLSICDNHNHNI